MFNRVRDLPILRNPDFRADWRRHYESRLVDAETAVAGIKSGDHVAFCVENHPQFHALAWGAYYAGLYYTAMSSRLTTDERAQLDALLDRLRPDGPACGGPGRREAPVHGGHTGA